MFDDYIGIPFKSRGHTLDGLDCFSLVRIIYKDLLNIDILKANSDAFRSKDIENEYLHETSKNWIEVDTLEKFDVVAMAHDGRIPDIVQHFGVYIGDGKMIHTLLGVHSHVVKIADYKYCIKSYHRYKKD